MLLSLVVGLFYHESLQAQNETKSTEKITTEGFQPEVLKNAVLKRVNAYRVSQKLDTLIQEELLEKVAKDQSEYMMTKKEVTLEQSSGKKRTTGNRLKFYGGSTVAEELVGGQAIGKGKENFTYDEVAAQIVDKWVKGKKTVGTLASGTNIYTGIGVSLDVLGKKVYVSQVFGGVKSFNLGATKKKELKVPFTKKKYGLKGSDDKECKACDKFNDFEKLYEGLYVENGKIYLKYDNLKALDKLLKNPKDGLAVDVIQKDQYPCAANYNIYDNNLLSKGVFVKRKWRTKIFKKNEIKDPKEKTKKLKAFLGKMPANIAEGDYELNLVVILNKHICKVITRKYKEEGDTESETPIDIMPDTIPKNPGNRYKPTAESNILSFIIPFQKNKYDYAPTDIKPFIEKLNEPDFIIDEIVISAYSSIEGDSIQNAELQRKRAESILKALSGFQKEKTVKSVKTGDSWEQFKQKVVGTPHEELASLSKNEAIKQIREKGIVNDLEPILAQGRYAQIVMDVTFDIKGKKEQPYVAKSFEKAIKKGDIEQAKAIQAFVFKKILRGDYNPDLISKVSIPKEAKYAPIGINRIWFEKQINGDTLSDKYCGPVKEWLQLAPTEDFVVYNSLYCDIQLGSLTKQKQIDSLQSKIDNLYSSRINKNAVDGLNLEFQFKLIDALDTSETVNPAVTKSIERIKKIYKLEESSWQNALKLSYIFMKRKDYAYAAKLLEPFIYQPKVGENLIYQYISICSYLPESLMSSKFNAALSRAKDMNHDRYCKLFGAPNLSFQVLDNPIIKNEYCKTCK